MQLNIKLDHSDFYEWTKHIFVKRTSNDMTYFQMVEHYGSECRENASFQYFQKSSDDVEELLDLLKPTKEEIPYIRKVLELSANLYGFCPLNDALFIVIIEPIDEPIEPETNDQSEKELEAIVDRIYQDPNKFALENKWDLNQLFSNSTIYVEKKGNILLCVDNTKHNPGLSKM
jgi:hypothetical protein